MAAIEAEPKPLGDNGYERQELRTERQQLLTLRQIVANKLATEPPPNPAFDARKQALIDRRARECREQITGFVEVLERQGHHRDARLWRIKLLTLRDDLEQHEFA